MCVRVPEGAFMYFEHHLELQEEWYLTKTTLDCRQLTTMKSPP